jgi:hypothetical protein
MVGLLSKVKGSILCLGRTHTPIAKQSILNFIQDYNASLASRVRFVPSYSGLPMRFYEDAKSMGDYCNIAIAGSDSLSVGQAVDALWQGVPIVIANTSQSTSQPPPRAAESQGGGGGGGGGADYDQKSYQSNPKTTPSSTFAARAPLGMLKDLGISEELECNSTMECIELSARLGTNMTFYMDVRNKIISTYSQGELQNCTALPFTRT